MLLYKCSSHPLFRGPLASIETDTNPVQIYQLAPFFQKHVAKSYSPFIRYHNAYCGRQQLSNTTQGLRRASVLDSIEVYHHVNVLCGLACSTKQLPPSRNIVSHDRIRCIQQTQETGRVMLEGPLASRISPIELPLRFHFAPPKSMGHESSRKRQSHIYPSRRKIPPSATYEPLSFTPKPFSVSSRKHPSPPETIRQNPSKHMQKLGLISSSMWSLTALPRL